MVEQLVANLDILSAVELAGYSVGQLADMWAAYLVDRMVVD